jgi:hypothetical protein
VNKVNTRCFNFTSDYLETKSDVMKMLLLLFFALVIGLNAKAQTQPADSLYLVTISLGETWDKTKKANEQTYFKEHSAHLKSLRDAGKIKFGARYSANGMLVITAPSFQAAKDMINSDPSMINKLFKNDIQKLFVFYDGCVSK